MPFDEETGKRPAEQFDVGYSVLLADCALGTLKRAVKKIAERANVDISEELGELERDLGELQREWTRLTGWRDE